MIFIGHQIIFRNSKADKVPDIGGGRISVSTHINGLVDPLVIVHSQDRRFTALGRHDLVTRPILGWWTRGLGIQPILRKAEMNEGITNSDFAGEINRRSMLTVSNCISNGYSAVVFPEGTSHQDSVLHGFKTGPFRTVFAAAAQPLAHWAPTFERVSPVKRGHALVATQAVGVDTNFAEHLFLSHVAASVASGQVLICFSRHRIYQQFYVASRPGFRRRRGPFLLDDSFRLFVDSRNYGGGRKVH